MRNFKVGEGATYAVSLFFLNDFCASRVKHRLKTCLRAGRKDSLEGRDDDGLIQNDGDWDGEVDELRSKESINVDRILEWRCVEDDDKEDGEDDVQCMTSEQTVNITLDQNWPLPHLPPQWFSILDVHYSHVGKKY